MSRMTREVTAQRKESIMQKHPVTNFIGSTCYQWNPVDTLKMITASSVFGEPAYYRDGEFEDASVTKIVDGIFSVNPLFMAYMVPAMEQYSGMKTSEVMEQAIDSVPDLPSGLAKAMGQQKKSTPFSADARDLAEFLENF